jgi:hypothetical protein
LCEEIWQETDKKKAFNQQEWTGGKVKKEFLFWRKKIRFWLSEFSRIWKRKEKKNEKVVPPKRMKEEQIKTFTK